MRVPVSVLRSFVPLPADLQTLVRTMNARVSEVEHVIRFPSREAFGGVTIVEAVRPVRQQGEHTRWEMVGGAHIVVGDKFGVEAGGRYAAVLAGASLPDGTAIDARPVAGMESDGALVSEAMLGIGKDAARPLRFAPDTALGANAWDALGLDDVVLEFDLEPNRPDLFSLLGMARDAGAIWSHPVTLPAALDLDALPVTTKPAIELRTPRARAYLAVAMTNVKVGPSPQWLQNVVRKLGMRPINNVVDAANLAMFELGQPLHTFDATRVGVPAPPGSVPRHLAPQAGQGIRRGTEPEGAVPPPLSSDALTRVESGAIVLRMAANGEKITTLDGVERALTDECLLVCDGERPVAIAGVMGDATSEVGDGTTDVLIESAAFDMAAVRRASRRLSLRTEASLRFEKGLPYWGVHRGAARLAQLLTEVAGATAVGRIEAGGAPAPAPAIRVDRARIRARLGMDVPDTEIDRILHAAGAALEAGVAHPPEYRPDLRIFEDLVEEIGRVFGYEHVRAEAPRVELTNPRANPNVVLGRRARRILTAAGWDEVYLPVWIGDAEVERFGYDAATLVKLINPLAENLVYFRPSALPALVEAAVQNRKELARFGLFEIGKTWRRASEADGGGIVERAHLAGVVMGDSLLAVRDVLAAFGAASGASLELGRAEPLVGAPCLHPGRCVSFGGASTAGPWAAAGELHPRLVRAFGLREAPVAFSVDLQALFGVAPTPVRFVPPPRFPSVEYDLNVTVPARTEVATVLAAVPDARGGAQLQSRAVVDIYALPDGARLTLRLVYNAGDRSLTQDEGAVAMEGVRGALAARGWKVG